MSSLSEDILSPLKDKTKPTHPKINHPVNSVNEYTYIHTYLIDRSPQGLFRANETQSTKQQNTTVKNPNWPEANQLAIYKCSWEVEPGTTRNKFNEWSERVLNPGSPDLKASALTTRPHCLQTFNVYPKWELIVRKSRSPRPRDNF